MFVEIEVGSSWFYYLRCGNSLLLSFTGGGDELAATLLEKLHGLLEEFFEFAVLCR